MKKKAIAAGLLALNLLKRGRGKRHGRHHRHHR
jgi:hypothetical protein